ncbi:radical SAM protein [Thermodesulfobacteriota bacterium]
MSNLGFLSIFCQISCAPLASCERVFLPPKDEIAEMKRRRSPLTSYESKKPVNKFDLLAFSISFENDYVNIVKMLDLASIPHYAEERNENHPLVIAGGIATFLNPEPIADFVDLFLLGDSPDMVNEFIEIYAELHATMPRDELIKELSKIKGVYSPSLYIVEYNDDKTIKHFRAIEGKTHHVDVQIAKNLSAHPAYSHIISKSALFSDMFLIEISRGCKRFCRFCAAGYNYQPYKKLSFDEIKEIIQKHSSDKKIGLVSAAVSDFKDIDKLSEFLVNEGKKFSVSSFRADSLSDTLLASLKASGHKTLTIAPEAGSQRMRDIIGKDISEEDILSAAKRIADAGILNVKLYYIIGLPFETDDDVTAIVTLTKNIRDIFLEASKKLKRAGKVSVSMHPFIPKPKTPFFFKGMDDEKSLKKKVKMVSNALKKEPNIKIEGLSLKEATLEALLARGTRELSKLLVLMSEGKSLREASKEALVDVDFYARRDIAPDETLPFDFIRSKIKKTFLIKEYEKAKEIAE